MYRIDVYSVDAVRFQLKELSTPDLVVEIIAFIEDWCPWTLKLERFRRQDLKHELRIRASCSNFVSLCCRTIGRYSAQWLAELRLHVPGPARLHTPGSFDEFWANNRSAARHARLPLLA